MEIKLASARANATGTHIEFKFNQPVNLYATGTNNLVDDFSNKILHITHK